MDLLSSWCYDGSFPENYAMPPERRPGNLIVPLGKSIPVVDLDHHGRNHTIQQILKAGEEYGFFPGNQPWGFGNVGEGKGMV
ncbi:hypothetical protein PTKIN_Ptkin15bG0116600 [Pterospermum kingtungense]